MSEGQREDDDEVAWLLARAKGQPGPSISRASAARYEKLEALLADLPATPGAAMPRAGWQERVLAAIDAEEASQAPAVPASAGVIAFAPRRRIWLVPVGIVTVAGAAAVTAALYFRAGKPERVAMGATLEVTIEPAGSNVTRGPVMVGDTLVVRGVVDGPGELRVYNDDSMEVAHCAVPAPGECAVTRVDSRTTLQLTMTLRARGAFRPILFFPPLEGPSAGLDLDIIAAEKARVEITRHEPVLVR